MDFTGLDVHPLSCPIVDSNHKGRFCGPGDRRCRNKQSRLRASVELTAHEFKTLRFFVQNPDRIITRTELLQQVCGYGDGYTSSRSIDNHLMALRHKLEKDPGCPTHFRTIPHLGYKFAF
ncbi:MAG: hypothetical protein DMG76_12945 [Acidobacteria bacterium]|nr:MAG: hypothetical protein DMG76_12945 [Acidobacteriota bacterium]